MAALASRDSVSEGIDRPHTQRERCSTSPGPESPSRTLVVRSPCVCQNTPVIPDLGVSGVVLLVRDNLTMTDCASAPRHRRPTRSFTVEVQV